MADSDLEAIRRARLQQLQAQGGSGGGEGSAQDEQRSRETAQRESILSQILEPLAADRLGRIRLVNPARAEDVERRLVALAQSGRLRARVTEDQLKEMLNAVAEQQKESAAEKVVVQRRKGGWDDDDLDDLLNMDD